MESKLDTVKSVEKAIDIVFAFTEGKPQLTLPEICKKLDLPKSTAYRLISTLEKKGFIEQNELNGKYQLGLKLIKISNFALKNYDLKDVALPIMTDLRDKTGETINLYIKKNLYRVCIEQVEGFNVLRRISSIGDLLPLFCGASGKLLTAFQKDEEITKIITESNITPFTENTIVDTDILKDELKNIRRQGFSFSRGERELGVASVSAPIRNHNGDVIAAISISGLDSRYTGENIRKYIKLVIEGATLISKNLGYSAT
ncbi:MAG: IclR family transcriptional regulator [Bacillota bacterium]